MKKTALVVIDVQNAMFMEEDPVYQGEVLIQNIKHLIEMARANDVPVFYVQHNEAAGQQLENGTRGWEIHPEIASTEKDIIIQKTTPDSFFKTNFGEQLQSRKIEHLVLVGIQSEVCVDTTCRSAYSQGYEITLVSDAHSTWATKNLSAQQIIDHHNETLRWFAKLKKTSYIQF